MGDVKISRLVFFVSFLNKSINVLNPQTALHIASVLCLNALTPPPPHPTPSKPFLLLSNSGQTAKAQQHYSKPFESILGRSWCKIVKKCNVVLFSLWFEVSSFHTNHHSVLLFFFFMRLVLIGVFIATAILKPSRSLIFIVAHRKTQEWLQMGHFR